jgi:serine/threonine protein phosphatase 1
VPVTLTPPAGRPATVADWLAAQPAEARQPADNPALRRYVTELTPCDGDTGLITEEPAQAIYLRNRSVAPGERTRFGGAPGVRRRPECAMRRRRQAPSVPADSRIYAIGDIHGRLDLLEQVEGLILDDAAAAPERRKVVVYLGDYVDRGPDSRAVVERLAHRPLPGFEAIHLRGNHEAMMLDFLSDIEVGPGWMWNGGGATLESYGVATPKPWTDAAQLEVARRRLATALPDDHRAFLIRLGLAHHEGDFLFAHAGIRPGVPLDAQDAHDLLWIREDFLYSRADHGAVVVHGHTIVDAPTRRHNRIAIDTGAYLSGRLTCLVLTSARVAAMQTQGPAGAWP